MNPAKIEVEKLEADMTDLAIEHRLLLADLTNQGADVVELIGRGSQYREVAKSYHSLLLGTIEHLLHRIATLSEFAVKQGVIVNAGREALPEGEE